MIDLRRITRTFPAQERKSPPLPVLSDITLRIPPGQYAAMEIGRASCRERV